MAILDTFISEPPPLQQDQAGTIHVGGTRVTLDTVVGTWDNGATAEEIAQRYDALALADVHAVLSYCLRHREEVQAYLDRRRQEAEEVRRENEQRFPSNPFRARLLARRDAQSRS